MNPHTPKTKEEILDHWYEDGMQWKSSNRYNILKAMEEYATLSSKGGVWVDAKERLPKMERVFFLKIDGSTMALGNFYEDDQCYMLYVQRNGAHDEYEKPYSPLLMNVEWLDESSNGAGDNEEIKLLKTALLKTDYREELERDNKDMKLEIERLKGLIDDYRAVLSGTEAWEQFKKEHNL